MVRVTTSQRTANVNPAIDTPHSTMRTASTGSSAVHFRCRWRCRTSGVTRRLLHLADHVEDLHRVRAQLLRELVLDGLRRLHEAALVDLLDDEHAHLLELGR